MAELRSFIIGVTIAALILAVGALAFGVLGGGGGSSPSAVLLSTPPATRTQQPAVTRTVLPTPPAGTGSVTGATTGAPIPTAAASATVKPTNTPAAASPTSVPPTATRAVQPTAVPPTATSVPVSPKTTYINGVNQYLGSFSGQLTYLVGNVNSPKLSDATWKQYTVQSAQSVQSLASQIAGVSAPSCESSAAATLNQGVNAASTAAGQVIAAVNAGDANALSAAASSLSSATGTINSGITAVQNATC